MLDTDACLMRCLGVGAGSMPEAWNPEPMVVDSGAAAEAADGEAEYTDTESVPTGYDVTDSGESGDFYAAPTAGR